MTRVNHQQRALFLSIRPPYAELILAGKKSVELRRVRPHVNTGELVLIYATSPQKAILGSALVDRISIATPIEIWKIVNSIAGVSKTEFENYFKGSNAAVGIHLRRVSRFTKPISLDDLRRNWPNFHVPQSYRYVSICRQIASRCNEVNGSLNPKVVLPSSVP